MWIGITELISQQEALNIVLNYLGQSYAGQIEVTDKLPHTSGAIYSVNDLKESWVIQVPKLSHEPQTIGMGRIICISMETGKIIYDGSDGGE